MRIVYIGTVEFSRQALKKLIRLKAELAGVVTMRSSKFNADFADLSGICAKEKIPILFVKDINTKKNQQWIKARQPDIIFCFGFSQLLKKGILEIAPKGAIGYHPARLPSNRGRHPLVWALALGLDKTASTFFFMDNGADSGDILSQEDVPIEYGDNARTLYKKVINTSLRQIEEFLPKLDKDNYARIPQDSSKSNTWRRRNRLDGRIDFRMNAGAIYNLVRALTRPYVGAHVVFGNEEIKIWKVAEENYGFPNIEYGKVLGVSRGNILVKCQGGAIRLIEHEFKTLPKAGEYLL